MSAGQFESERRRSSNSLTRASDRWYFKIVVLIIHVSFFKHFVPTDTTIVQSAIVVDVVGKRSFPYNHRDCIKHLFAVLKEKQKNELSLQNKRVILLQCDIHILFGNTAAQSAA